MAVFRLPPVAQFQQPRVYADTRSTDAPIPQTPEPLQQIVWLRRRPDFETDQQPRRLLDVSITSSVDSPIPATNEPLQQLTWLRRRTDFEAEQQPRRLSDTSVSQSVDSPIPNAVPLELTLRARWPYPAQRGLPVDILAPAVVADNPTGAPYAQWVGRPQSWEQWLQARPVDTSYTQSVDAPIPNSVPVEPTIRTRWNYTSHPGLPVDILAPVVTPDNPSGVPAQQVPYLRAPSPAYWQNRTDLDTSITASVDAPPGFFVQQPALRPTSLTQWHQQTPGLISSPDSPAAPVQQAAAYLRGAAALQAYQKTPSVLFLVTVESPPTAGPFQPAIYRRPVPPTPYRLPSTSIMVAEPVAPVDPAPYLATAMERFNDEAMERFMATALERFVDDALEAFEVEGTERL